MNRFDIPVLDHDEWRQPQAGNFSAASRSFVYSGWVRFRAHTIAPVLKPLGRIFRRTGRFMRIDEYEMRPDPSTWRISDPV